MSDRSKDHREDQASKKVLIIVSGHALNLGLCVASAVVHSLRLNLIEYLHWSLEDEGHPFTPFLRKERLSWTNS